ncbi:glycosyltransferase [Jatrophihabitans sp. YIM 134969]
MDVDVVVPVYNEQATLVASVERLHAFLTQEFPLSWRITIADNASIDSTWAIASDLASTLPGVTAVHLDAKGRGRALRRVWSTSESTVVAYMDVDLSTDLKALLPLVAPLVSGHSDVAIGTRLGRGARVVRGPKRELISRSYNLLLRTTLRTRFTDAQCGFKAVRTDLARQLLPLVEDTGWFFDTELLFLAQRSGLRIAEVPVDWVDDPDSRVDIVATALADLRGVLRLGRGVLSGSLSVATLRHQIGRHPDPVPGVEPGLVRQLVRFGAVGVLSTLAYLLLFVLLRGGLGAQPANFLALLVTAVGNTAVNRRFTFGVRDRAHRARDHLAGLAAFGLGLGLTAGSLAVLHAVGDPGRPLELSVLVLANLAATLLRFVVLRTVVTTTRRNQGATR